MTRHRFVVPFLVLFTLAWLPATAQAQDLAEFWKFTVKPGNQAGFEQALKAHIEFREANGDPWDWFTHQVTVGEEIGTYYVASWDHEWADFDAYDAWEGGAAAVAHFQATVAPLLEDMSNEITENNRSIERMHPDPTSVSLVNVTTFYINPGKQMQFNEVLTKWHETIVENDMPFYYASDYLVAGGEGPVFSIAGFGASWADFAEPDPNMEQIMVEKYGEEEAMEIFTAFGESVHHWKNMIVRFRSDLSSPMGM